MTQPIQPATAAAGTTTSSTTSKSSGATVDKDMFLRLLVEQIKHQDPQSPTDSQQWLAQMAQFSTVEQLTNMAKSSAQGAAVNLIGHDVTYDAGTGKTAQGTVEQVTLGPKGPTLTVSGQGGIDPSKITDVR